jgi:hypothetical protein
VKQLPHADDEIAPPHWVLSFASPDFIAQQVSLSRAPLVGDAQPEYHKMPRCAFRQI